MGTVNDTLRTSVIADAVTNLNRLDIRTSGGAGVLATFTITWAAGAAGVQEVQSTPVSTTASAGGTAAEARLYKNDATPDEQITGLTVGTGSEDVVIDNTTIANGQTINLTAGSLTFPAATT